MPTSNYSISFNATLAAATSVSIGQAMVINSSGTWVVATSANRTSYGRSRGIARSAYSGSGTGAVDIQHSGVYPAAMATGTASWVRVDANGALERVTTPSGSDDVIGHVNAYGDLTVLPMTQIVETVSLPLSIANGGTNNSGALSAGALKSTGSAVASAGLGTALQVLRTNAGATDVEWGSASGVAGADTQVQFNDGGAQAGEAGFTYNKTTDTATLVGGIIAAYHATTGTVPATGLVRFPYSAADTVISAKNDAAADKGFLTRTGVNKWQLAHQTDWDLDVYSNNLNVWGRTTFIFFAGAGGGQVGRVSADGWQFGSGALDFGGGTGVLGIDNATANPSTNPTGGGILYVTAGALTYRGSGGTVTTLGPADLDGFKATGDGHCPSCGTDFAHEWSNDAYGALTICMKCLADEIGDRPWIVRRPKKAA